MTGCHLSTFSLSGQIIGLS